MTPQDAVDGWLLRLLELPPGTLPGWMIRVIDRLQKENGYTVETVSVDVKHGYYVLVERSVDLAILDDYDDKPSLTGAETKLRDHLSGVGARAGDYGRRLGLSNEVVEDLRLAGELHDLGKVDLRFQAQMRGHDEVLIALDDEPLAKSLRGARPIPGQWPPVRHEFSSVALAQRSPAILDLAHDPDLVLHLVGTHHGHGRPLPPIKKDDHPQELTAAAHSRRDGFRLGAANGAVSDIFEEACGDVRMSVSSDLAETPLALEMADRFWRLQECYGHHGLAWLEAILRLADHQQSAEEGR